MMQKCLAPQLMLYLGSNLGNWQDLDFVHPPFLPVASFVLYLLSMFVVFDPIVSSTIYVPLQISCL